MKFNRCEVCGKKILHPGRRFCSRPCYYIHRSRTDLMLVRPVLKDPTPAEIAQRAAEVRATWTPEERVKRLAPCMRRKHWTLPNIDVDALQVRPKAVDAAI